MPFTTTRTTLFSRLKSGTSMQHQALEDALDVMSAFRSRARYAAYLARAEAFYAAVEKELGTRDWPAIGIDFEARRKTALLQRDLSALCARPIQEEMDASSLAADGLPSAIGCLYVLEGATLGGQVIHRQLQKLGVTPENGGAFFNGYGPRTGEMWRSFQAAATLACTEPEQIEEAVRGAGRMFDLFAAWMTPWRAAP